MIACEPATTFVYEPKVWGETACLCCSPRNSLHHLRVVAGGYSSRHYHIHRGNVFCVYSGRIAVETWDSPAEWFDGERCRREVLGPGQSCYVGSGVVHRFVVLESGEVLESYVPDGGAVDDADIVRLDVGGMNGV